jgi:hypothetical protein
MTDLTFPPPGLGIPDEDWQHTPESVRRAIHVLAPLSQPDIQTTRSREDMLAAIENGFGLLAGDDTIEDWYNELKEERQRDDERFDKWFNT